MRVAWIAAAASVMLIASVAWGDSQSPVSAQTKEVQQPPISPNKNADNADSVGEHRGSPSAPTTQISEEVDRSKAADDNSKKHQKSSYDWGPVVIGALTIMLMGLQAYIYFRQAKIMATQVGISERQAVAAERQTEIVNTQVNLMDRQAIIMNETLEETKTANKNSYLAAQESINRMESQLKLARDEFNATHRPILKTKRFTLTIDHGNRSATIRFEVVNEGDTEARIIRSNTTDALRPIQHADFPLPPLYGRHDEHPEPIRIAPGGSEVFTRTIEDTEDHRIFRRVTLECSSWILYCFGFVTYFDVSDRRRDLYFCKVFDWETKRFESAENEYDDAA